MKQGLKMVWDVPSGKSSQHQKMQIPKGWEIVDDKSAEGGLSSYLIDTSFTALALIYKAPSLFQRIAWMVVVILMLSLLTMQFYELLTKYFSYPMDVTLDVKNAMTLEFPSVTVCNLNPILMSSLYKNPAFKPLLPYADPEATDMLFEETMQAYGGMMANANTTAQNVSTNTNNATTNTASGTTQTPSMMGSDYVKWDCLQSSMCPSNTSSRYHSAKDINSQAIWTYSYITAQMDDEILEKYGHHKKDFIASCSFNGLLCSPNNFTYTKSHQYGNCYTFHSHTQDSQLDTAYSGPSHGLSLELYLGQSEYVADMAPEAGARILIHEKGTMPFPEEEGISVQPGTSTSIGIKQVRVSRLPPPYGVCADHGLVTDYYALNKNTDYRKLSCLKSCQQDVAMELCQCAVPFFYVGKNDTPCNMSDSRVVQCVTSDIMTHRRQELGDCDIKCPSPCQEILYDVTTSIAKWPSQRYKETLTKLMESTNMLYMGKMDTDIEFTKVQIYYKDLLYEHIEQHKAYEYMNLISDLGGQLGLWLGLSAVTIGELLSYVFGAAKKISVARLAHNNKTKHSEAAQSNGPVTFDDLCDVHIRTKNVTRAQPPISTEFVA